MFYCVIYIYVKKLKLKIVHCVKDNDTINTVNIKMVALQVWHIITRTRTIAMFYLKCKIARGLHVTSVTEIR